MYIKWTPEKLQKEALKYSTIIAFQKGSHSAYMAAIRKGILELVCSHMTRLVRKAYTDEELHQIALKYSTRYEFQKKSKGASLAAYNKKILDIICSHMLKPDMSGQNSPVFKWSLEKLQAEALKYSTRKEFEKNNYGAYQAACKRKILDGICQHMNRSNNISLSEQNLFEIIKQNYPKIQKLIIRKKNLMPNKPHVHGFDIDMYIPELSKGIEFDGKYWHSIPGLKRSRSHWPEEDLTNYSKIKDEYFLSKGIKILHIDEKDWIKNKEECINKCLEFLIK